MLELPDFGHMTTSTTSTFFFENTFIVRRPRLGIFADVIKIGTILIKKSLKTQN